MLIARRATEKKPGTSLLFHDQVVQSGQPLPKSATKEQIAHLQAQGAIEEVEDVKPAKEEKPAK